MLAQISWDEIWPLAVAIGIVMAVIPGLGLYMTFIERKAAAYIHRLRTLPVDAGGCDP